VPHAYFPERASPVTRARKSLDDKIAELTKRQQQLEAQRLMLLASKKTANRKLDTRRKIIVGAAVLTHAELHPDFSTVLRDILSVAVQRNIDRRAIADLLDHPQPNDPDASQPPRTSNKASHDSSIPVAPSRTLE
jgi:hypothetical protein